MRLPHHMCRVSVPLIALLVASLLSPLPATATPDTLTVVSISRDAANPIAPGTPFSWTVTFSPPSILLQSIPPTSRSSTTMGDPVIPRVAPCPSYRPLSIHPA